MSRANRGMNAIYNGGLSYNGMHGGGFFDSIKKGIQWAKDNKVASKIGAVADAVGATNYLNEKTGGKFGQAIDMAKEKGFGRRRRKAPSKGGAKKRGRPRKTNSGSKTAVKPTAGGRRRRR